MDNQIKILAELLKQNDSLQDIEFTFKKHKFKWYYKYLTMMEKIRIEQMTVKRIDTIDENGNKSVEYKKHDELIPIHTILEKALNEDGKKIFSHTNPEHFSIIKELPAGISSQVAYLMTIDILGTMEDKNGE